MSRSEWFESADDANKGGEGSPPPRPPRGPRPSGPVGPRRRSPIGITLAILAALVLLGTIAADVVTDLWWFDSVGFQDVFLTVLGSKALLFVLAWLVTAALVVSSLVIGYRTRPLYVPMTPGQQALEQYRELLHPLRRLVLIVVPTVLGLLAGAGAMGAWQSMLLWLNRTTFGTKDPQFGLDIGFFVFTLPWLRFIVSFLSVVLVLALVAAVVTHYVYGGLQLPGRGKTTRAAFIHLSVLGALLAIVRAGGYWLDRYELTTGTNTLNTQTGMTYTDVHAVMPTKAILAAAAIMCAGFFLASIWTRSWRLPIIGVGLLTVLAVVVGGIYPAIIQSLKVRPSEKSLEATYIKRNIDATRAAYGIADMERTPYTATTDAEPGQLRADAETIPGIRLMDPNVISPTFRQYEGLRTFYAFPQTLDVDRYSIDGTNHDSVVAVREINLAGVDQGQRNWLNDHTVFTHGYGFIGAFGNTRTSEGDPEFFQGGFASDGPVGKYEPRIYFGEISPVYSIVGAPEGAEPREFDIPDDKAPSGQRNNTYTGSGGVAIGGFAKKAAYAVKYRELKFLLSDAVNSESRILDHRDPKERVSRVAPWLTLDGNTYPAVVDGRVQWIVDGYTTSARYPNSRMTDLGAATADSVTESSRFVRAGEGRVNYMRNSVKATVDAYDGTVRLYAWDTSDPVLRAWTKAFPTAVRPLSDISGPLMAHLRYPQDMLKVQRQLVARYHVTEPGAFFSGQDFWRVPKDPTHDTQDLPTYYQSLQMPGQDKPAFSLTTTFIPGQGREILRGFLAVDADAGTTAGKPAPGYGKLRLLELPGDSAVDGPGQVQNQIEISTARSQSASENLNLSQFIAQNRQSGKQLTYGNLLTLPVGGGLLYVQPMYVQASKSDGSFPQNKATVAVFGKKIAWGDTLDQALDGLFGGNSGASAGDKDAGGPAAGGADKPGGTDSAPTSASAQLAAVIAQMQRAQADADAALKKSDFAAYGEAQKRLQAAIDQAAKIAPSLEPKE